MGYKARPSPPEARLAEHGMAEAEPAEPQSKSRPHSCHSLTEDEETRHGEVVTSHSIGAKDEREQREAEGKGCSVSESAISGLAPCPSPLPAPDPACLVTATGNAPQVELSQGCPGQRAVLEEPQLAKEQTDDREHEKEDTEVDEAEKTLPEPECNVSVPEDHHEDRQEEEAGDREEENVQVVDEEEEANRRIDSVELPSTTLLPPQTSDRIVPASAAQLQGAYMWSLELLIAAALCATRDALYPPSPTVQMPSPPTHHGMEILGELAELEIQNRNRDSKEKGLEGKGLRG